MRNELDVTKPVNLRRLTPLMKIYAGIMSKWNATDWHKTRLNERLEIAHALQVEKDEKLKEALLVQIYKELNDNHTLSDYNEICREVVLCVQSDFIHSLDRVLKHKDFLPYVVTKVSENADVRLAFPDMPVLLRVSKKTVGGDK